MRAPSALLAAALLCATAGRSAAQHPLATLPLDDPAYVQLEALSRQGCAAARPSVVRPYETRVVREAVAAARESSRCTGLILDELVARFGAPADTTERDFSAGLAATARATARRDLEFRPLWRDARPDSEGDPTVVGRLAARATWGPTPRFVAVAEGYAQSNSRNDPTVRGRGFRQSDAVVDISEAYVAGRIGPVTIQLGRSAEAWLGEGRESIAFSAHGPPLDRVRASARWKRWEANAFFGTINDVVLDAARDSLDPAIGPQRFHRFFAAHELTFRPSPALAITIGETALLTRRGAGVDLAFVNPVMPYIVAENDTTRTGPGTDDDNLTAFGAVSWAVGPAHLAAELLVDDIQIDSKDRKNIPDQLAWRLAGTVGVPIGRPASVGLEYRHINSYTYMRASYAEVYQAYDQPLGSELGPDADELRATGELWANSRLRLAGTLGRWRRGALRVDQRPGAGAFGHAGEPFPSVSASRPGVQGTWLGDVTVQFVDRIFPVTVRAELARIDNVNNQPASAANEYRVSVAGTYRFRYP